jgi:hypothetical protein
MTAPTGGKNAPERSRRALFAALLTIYILWMAGMLVLYFTTVRPRRRPHLPSAAPEIPATPETPATQ